METERTRFLRRVRRALDPRPSPRESPAAKQETQQRALWDGDLSSLLKSSMEALGGTVESLPHARGVRAALSRFVERREIHRVVVLADEFIRSLHLEQALEEVEATWIPDLSSGSRAGDRRLMERAAEADLGVFPVFRVLAHTGTMVLRGKGALWRSVSLLPPRAMGIVRKEHVLYGLGDLLKEPIASQYVPTRPGEALICMSGPSRTADIEANLTLGVHGPGETHLLVLG